MISHTKLKNNKGFTIVELLIVIVVIGILALLVITTYSGIQGKARNSKRQTDLAALQTHLEAFYNDNGFYPTLTEVNDTTFVAAKFKGLDVTAFIDPSNPTQSKTMAAAPVAKSYAYEVKDAAGAVCTVDTNCTKYTLTATYEGTVNGSTTYVKNSLN
ncbi:MAG: prepilin-type N-terminal cleavage/methylation domain-containing protein [Patescibacteria group bacterium]|nr:prepilin-type N-terminal cleavage/methylation domain-containing protein [Patescibacteria group bacterium]